MRWYLSNSSIKLTPAGSYSEQSKGLGGHGRSGGRYSTHISAQIDQGVKGKQSF